MKSSTLLAIATVTTLLTACGADDRPKTNSAIQAAGSERQGNLDLQSIAYNTSARGAGLGLSVSLLITDCTFSISGSDGYSGTVVDPECDGEQYPGYPDDVVGFLGAMFDGHAIQPGTATFPASDGGINTCTASNSSASCTNYETAAYSSEFEQEDQNDSTQGADPSNSFVFAAAANGVVDDISPDCSIRDVSEDQTRTNKEPGAPSIWWWHVDGTVVLTPKEGTTVQIDSYTAGSPNPKVKIKATKLGTQVYFDSYYSPYAKNDEYSIGVVIDWTATKNGISKTGRCARGQKVKVDKNPPAPR